MINICDNNNNIYMIYIKQIYNSIEVYMYVIMYSLVKVGKKIFENKKKKQTNFCPNRLLQALNNCTSNGLCLTL